MTPVRQLINVDFSGAVIANEGHDLTPPDGEVDALKGVNRAKMLLDAGHLQDRGRRGGVAHGLLQELLVPIAQALNLERGASCRITRARVKRLELRRRISLR